MAAAGWDRHFVAIVVSQRVGAIKPQAAIFRAAEAALGIDGERILHVGDDWAADVVGARRAGWRAAYLRDRQGTSPLPSSVRDDAVEADLELDRLADLPAASPIRPPAVPNDPGVVPGATRSCRVTTGRPGDHGSCRVSTRSCPATCGVIAPLRPLDSGRMEARAIASSTSRSSARRRSPGCRVAIVIHAGDSWCRTLGAASSDSRSALTAAHCSGS